MCFSCSDLNGPVTVLPTAITFFKVSFVLKTKQHVEGGFGTIEAANSFASVMRQRGARQVEVTSYIERR